ncbi:MAG: lipopolysaccharide biosynthesis protein [Candidatus Methylumidiphilus sp.]
MSDSSQPAQKPGRVSRNAASQMLGRIVYLLTRVAIPPFIIHYISLEEYGIWATCFLIISYIGMGAFGVSNVYVRYVAEYSAKQRLKDIGPLLGAGLTMTITFSVVTLCGLWFALPWLYAWFKIPDNLHDTAAILILGTVATMLLDMTFGAFAYVLQGLQRIAEQTLVWTLGYLLETALMVVFLMQGWGVNSLLWAFAARYVVATLIYVLLCYRAIPGLHISLRGVGWETYRLFFRYGGIMQVSGLLSVFLYSSERLVAGKLTGVASVVLLDIGQKFPMMSTQVFSSANNSFLTALTHLHSLDQHDEVARLYLRSSRYLNILNGSALGFMAAFALTILSAWIGVDHVYAESEVIFVSAALGYHLHALTGPASSYFQGISHPERGVYGYLLPQIILLGSGLVAAYAWWGHTLSAVVLAASFSRIGSSMLYLLYTNSQIGIGQWRFVWQVLLPGLAPYVLGYGLAFAAHDTLQQLGTGRFVLIAALAVLAAAYGALLALMLYGVFCQTDERQSVKRVVFKLLGKRR